MPDTSNLILNCADCHAPAEVLYVESRRDKYDIVCSKGCKRDFDCKRNTLEKATKFWNKVQTKKADARWKPKTNLTAAMDNKDDVPRCKCGLALPCNDCLKTIDYYAQIRKGGEPIPATFRKM